MIGRARVVVVDDDRDLRELLVQVLTDLGLEAVGYGDGRAALEGLRGAAAAPAAILLDLEMPGMSGWELRRELLRDPALARIPVVVSSGSDPASLPVDAVLPKPYGIAELCQVLAAVGETAARPGAAPPGSH